VRASVAPNLLLVEDEPLIRMGLADSCEREGFIVVEAGDGLEAVSLLKLHPSIRLVVSDVDMPRMDGIELTKKIHKDFQAIQVVLVSGKTYLRTDDFPEVPFFEKPVHERALLECLKRLTEHIVG
jgi:two-component system, response regulator PdtaR